jgi:hypothetical protein
LESDSSSELKNSCSSISYTYLYFNLGNAYAGLKQEEKSMEFFVKAVLKSPFYQILQALYKIDSKEQE